MLEKLVFGTAPLGLAYGLGRDGQPARLLDESVAAAIVAHAIDTGICTFDSAPAYGLAEARLGRSLGARGSMWTKLGREALPGPSLLAQLQGSLDDSLRALCRPRIELLQWHNWTAWLAEDAHFIRAWRALRDDSRVGALGASTYGVDDALAAVRSGLFDSVQVEWSLLNQSVVEAIAAEAARRGIRIAVRSVFLQGALTDEVRVLPDIYGLRRAVAAARAVALHAQVSLQHLALRAALDHPAITHVLVGIDRQEQVTEAAQIARAGALGSDLDFAVRALCLGSDPSVDPRTWGTAKSVVPVDLDDARSA